MTHEITPITRASAASVSAGSDITFSYTLQQGQYPLDSAQIQIQDAGGFIYTANSMVNGNTGTARFSSSASSWLSGNYTVVFASVSATAGVATLYTPDGVTAAPESPFPDPPPIDFGPLKLSLTEGLSSITAPSLVSLSFVNTTVAQGGTLGTNYSVIPGTAGDAGVALAEVYDVPHLLVRS